MRQLLIFIIVIAITFIDTRSSSVEFRVQDSKAVAPLVMAPAAAIAALEASILLVAGLYAIRVIKNPDVRDRLISEMEILKAKIRSATGAALKVAIEATVDVLLKVQTLKSSFNCLNDRRSKPRGEICSGNVDACCEKFRNKFADRLIKRSGALMIFSNSRKNKLLCCLEWDNVHSGLEIFDDRGIHRGERGCEDENDDPCKMTASRGAHASAAPATHRPSSPACRR